MTQPVGAIFTSHEQRLARKAAKAPMLKKDHEQELVRRWRETSDHQALTALIESHMRLVLAMAKRLRGYGLPLADLIQEGAVGLMEAAARFDPDRDIRFSTYANWWVRAAMQDFILRNWSIVRTGTTAAHKSLFFNLRRLQARINGAGAQAQTPDARAAIAQQLGVKTEDVAVMEGRLSGGDLSLNMPVGGEDSDSDWLSFLADDDATRPDEAVTMAHDEAVRAKALRQALEQLNPRERTVIHARQLAEDKNTLSALGEELGISKERVRQIEAQAMRKLRAHLLDEQGKPLVAGLAYNA
ncbi:MAG: RNA polymerase factor sigma-32 [Sphingomonadales bacterium]